MNHSELTPGQQVTWLALHRSCLEGHTAIVVMLYPQKVGIAVRVPHTDRWTPKVVPPSSLRVPR